MTKQSKQAKPKKQSTKSASGKSARAPDQDSAEALDERDSVGREVAGDVGDDGEGRNELPDQDRAMNSGETWLEALEQRSAEGGPRPEQEIDVTDDETNGRRDR